MCNVIAISQHVFNPKFEKKPLKQLKPKIWNFRGHYYSRPEVSTYQDGLRTGKFMYNAAKVISD